MTTNTNNTNHTCQPETLLRHTFGKLDRIRYQEIKDAYYQAVEGLRALADALEVAEAENPGPASELLLGEHLLACNAIDTMKHSLLGKIL